jgi:hypothetical protein
MHLAGYALALLTLLGAESILRADPDIGTDADDIPVVGRPSDLPFSEASGRFEVSTRATPTTVEEESPLTFTITVRATRDTRRPPQRLDLRQLPVFEEQFHVEDVNEEANRPDDRTWEFVYRLKPRRLDVSEIPGLPFVYFDPYLLTASKGFQVVYTDAIPLRVLPRESVQVPVSAPDSAFVLDTSSDLLDRQTVWTPPGLAMSLVLLLTPPIVCAGWYLCWRRMYPDVARLARQRRSRAAREALRLLEAARRLDAESCADRAAALVADYLRERLELAIAEPTPREIALLFEQRNGSPGLTEQAVRFFEACDGVRFRPATLEASDLPELATKFILAVEEETCPAEPS